ncbi:hypothetical protein Tco_0475359 [Tanacetum coccineum]
MSMRIASANWKDFVSQLASICTNNSVVSMLRKMVLQCLLYMAREEQKTFYTQEIRTEKAVTECISEAVNYAVDKGVFGSLDNGKVESVH